MATTPLNGSTTVESTRTAGPGQARLLLLASCLPVLGIVLIAPVQPAMAAAFADTPGVEVLIPMVVTAPAIAIAIVSPFAGALADRFGRKRLLIIAAVIYAVFGTAPLWLDSLGAIVASRVLLGVAEAMVITISTTLIAAYFRDDERRKYLGYQVVVTTVAGTVFLALGGALGSLGWRVPFWMYLASLVFGIVMMAVLWEPPRAPLAARGRIAWSSLAVPLVVTVLGAMVFYVLIVYLPFLLAERGIADPATIGLVAAAASLATAAGAFVFRFIAKRGLRPLFLVGYGIAGLGIVSVWFATSLPWLIGSAMVASFGTGMIVPTMLTWTIGKLDPSRLGVGTGAWQCALFLGQFVMPLLVGAVAAAVGGLPPAVGVVGVIGIVVALVGGALARRAPTEPREDGVVSSAERGSL